MAQISLFSMYVHGQCGVWVIAVNTPSEFNFYLGGEFESQFP